MPEQKSLTVPVPEQESLAVPVPGKDYTPLAPWFPPTEGWTVIDEEKIHHREALKERKDWAWTEDAELELATMKGRKLAAMTQAGMLQPVCPHNTAEV